MNHPIKALDACQRFDNTLTDSFQGYSAVITMWILSQLSNARAGTGKSGQVYISNADSRFSSGLSAGLLS